MRLALVISSLRGGGAERVMATLANAWAARGVEVTLITLAPRSTDAYPVDAAVERIDLYKTARSSGFFTALANNWARIHALRKAIVACRPDAVISFIAKANILTVLAATGLRVPVVVAEHTFAGAKAPDGMRGLLHGPLYRRAAAVVALTRRGADYIQSKFGCPVTVIPNPVPFPNDAGPVARRRENPIVLAVGRLIPLKGFDLLIEAFARVAERHPEWKLRIVGEGESRPDLAQAIASSGLSDRISMPGFTDNVREEMRQAGLFVLSSRFEGFPMALLEAMSEGLACISFDCETGPGELIDHRENGWLVPANDVPALADALDVLMGDADLRERLGSRARDVGNTYSLPRILDQWEALLKPVLSHAGSACLET